MRLLLTALLFLFVSSAFADKDGDGVEDAVDNCPEIANSDQTDADADGRGDACDLFTVEIDNRFPDPLGIKVKVRAPEDKTISHYSFRLFHYGAFGTCGRDFIRQGGGTSLEDTFTYSLHPLSRSGDYALSDFRITTGDGEQIKEIQESYRYPIRIENSLAATEPVRLESWVYFADPARPNRLGIKAILSGVVDGFKEELYSWDYDADQPRIGYKWTIWKNDDSGEWIQASATKDNIVEIADRVYEVTSYFDMPQPVVDAPKIVELVACDQTIFDLTYGRYSDADGDLAYDEFDAFPDDPEEWYDNDGDGTGDQADSDDDDDGIEDALDVFPLDSAEWLDSDQDGVGNNADPFPNDPAEAYDQDDDGIGDNADNCPSAANETQLDTDGDFSGDACDLDDDNDTLPDSVESITLRNAVLPDFGIATWQSFSCAITDSGVECWGNDGNDKLTAPVFYRPRQIGTGSQHACVLDETPAGNEVICWGWNGNGETDVPDLKNPTQLSVGSQSSCAIDDTGVKCWGWNGNGETNVPALINPRKLGSGDQNHCALDDRGVTCWGFNGNLESSPPTNLEGVSAVDAGVFSGCAAMESGAVCWGLLSEEAIPFLDKPFAIGVGINFACALDSTGLKCWGPGNVYQQKNIPTLENPVQLSVGEEQVCVLDDLGYHCWGKNDEGQSNVPANLLIDADFDGITSQGGLDAQPLEVIDTDGDGVADLFDEDDDDDGLDDLSDSCPTIAFADQLDTDSDGLGDACDTDDDGDGIPDVWELNYGYDPLNPDDALLDQDNDALNTVLEFERGSDPSDPDSDKDTISDGFEAGRSDPSKPDYLLRSGGHHSCFLDDELLRCWGHNNRFNFDKSGVTDFSSYGEFSCLIRAGELECWGSDQYGGTEPPALVAVTDIDVGKHHACAISESGLACWGSNEYGQSSVPELVEPMAVSAGTLSTCAIDQGSVKCWGSNVYGHLGVPPLLNPRKVVVGYRIACALDDLGLQCWGDNEFDQLDMPDLKEPYDFDIKFGSVCALDRSGVVCWGRDMHGETSPPKIEKPAQISLNYEAACAFGTAGVTCWGRSDAGSLEVPLLIIDPDGDGYTNQGGLDLFPENPSEHQDIDQDGVGDNGDAFPEDGTEWADSDADGVGDNADAFPDDASEVADADGDGYGDNADAFDDDPSEVFDNDSDGIGDNADLDDDNDGFTDEEELVDGTDPLNRFSCRSGCFSFDVDENLEAQPLTDGLLVIRHLFGFSGDSLISGAVSGEAGRDSSEAITGYLTDADSQLDIDGDGESKPLTDGLLLIRYLFGFSGDSLISGAIGSGAERDTAEEVEAYIQERVPAQ